LPWRGKWGRLKEKRPNPLKDGTRKTVFNHFSNKQHTSRLKARVGYLQGYCSWEDFRFDVVIDLVAQVLIRSVSAL